MRDDDEKKYQLESATIFCMPQQPSKTISKKPFSKCRNETQKV